MSAPYQVGDVIVCQHQGTYWRVTNAVSDNFGRTSYDLEEVGESEDKLRNWPDYLVNDSAEFKPHQPTVGDLYKSEVSGYIYTLVAIDGRGWISLRSGDLTGTYPTLVGFILVGRTKDTTCGATTPSVPTSGEPMTEGEALMAFFAADRGTWTGYSGSDGSIR